MTFQLQEAIDLLERTPAICRAWMRGLAPGWLESDEGPETFSPRDVVAHLVQGEEEDWLARTHILLEHGEERPFDPFDRFGFRTRYAGQSIEELLDRFEMMRSRNLAALRAMGLSADDLAQRGTHPDLGPVTLSQLLATWVVHDQAHLAQIARVLAKRYGDEVGAWREYLNVLKR